MEKRLAGHGLKTSALSPMIKGTVLFSYINTGARRQVINKGDGPIYPPEINSRAESFSSISSSMPRTKRLISSEYPLHIMVRGNNKQALFREDRDKRCYLGLVSKFRTQSQIDIYHYCLMNNHVHLLLQAQKPDLLSKFMMKIDLSYFFIFQSKYGYVGHLFQNRFKSTIINCDAYLLQCGKYIELNPVRAGMIAAPEDYPFSSYRHYAYGANDRLVSMDPVYAGLSDEEDRRRKLYREFVVDSALISTEKARRSLFIGGEDFMLRMEKEFGVAGELRPRGRPSKNK